MGILEGLFRRSPKNPNIIAPNILIELIDGARPRGPLTVFGKSSIETLVRGAAMQGTSLVETQLEKVPARFDVKNNTRMRLASDAFVAGYAIGCASIHIQVNGRGIEEVPFDALLSETSKRLSNALPDLDIAGAYRNSPIRFAGGMVAGVWEPGNIEEPRILTNIWSQLSEHTRFYGTNIYQYSMNKLCIDYRCAELIHVSADEIFQIYMSDRKLP